MKKIELADGHSKVSIIVHITLENNHKKSRLKVGEHQAVKESRHNKEHQRKLNN